MTRLPKPASKQRLYALLRRIVREDIPSELDHFDHYGRVDFEAALAELLSPSALQKISWTQSGHFRASRLVRSAALIAATIRTIGATWSDRATMQAIDPIAEQWSAQMEASGLEKEFADRVARAHAAELLEIIQVSAR